MGRSARGTFLIIPAAIYLGAKLAWRGRILAAASTAAGVTASLLWAFAYTSPTLEPWWIGLAAAWWLGLGWLLRSDHRGAPRTLARLGSRARPAHLTGPFGHGGVIAAATTVGGGAHAGRSC